MGGQYEHTCPNCFSDGVEGEKCDICGYSAVHTNPVALPYFTLLDRRYLTGKVLGIGGFGITYLAKDLQANKLCAVKEYLPAELVARDTQDLSVKVSGAGRAQVFEHGLSSFYDEAKVLGSLSDHDGIVKVYDIFKQYNTAYLVMEYLEGVTLQRLTGNQGRLHIPTAGRILLEVMSALTAVHAKGILHRDISPENIFITRVGKTKLIDFGAAKHYVSGMSQTLSIVLKPGYAPPEQYSCKGNQGPWTDIYALGCTFYYALSGLPVPSALDRLSGASVKSLNELDSRIPVRLSRAIDRAMELDIQDRPQSISALDREIRPPREGVPAQQPLQWNRQALRGESWPVVIPAKPCLEVVSGPLAGQRWELVPNVPVQVGRSAKYCEIAVGEGAGISRIHCLLWYDETSKSFFMQDCSRNGTYSAGGKRYENGRRYMLEPGTEFYLATKEHAFKVSLDDGSMDQLGPHLRTIERGSMTHKAHKRKVPPVKTGVSMHIGAREYQQDACFVPDSILQEACAAKGYLGVLCDGMGGLNGGEKASRLCVEQFAQDFYAAGEIDSIPEFLAHEIELLDAHVCSMKDENGNDIHAGTTLVCTVVYDGQMYWASAGDSRIYIVRNKDIFQLTRDHNYALELARLAERGVIEEEEVRTHPERDSLISFVGMDGMRIIDGNPQGVPLQPDDVVMLCSDGLYRTMSENEILSIIAGHRNNMELAAHILIASAFDKGIRFQDNMSVVLMSYGGVSQKQHHKGEKKA